jgi:integrase
MRKQSHPKWVTECFNEISRKLSSLTSPMLQKSSASAPQPHRQRRQQDAEHQKACNHGTALKLILLTGQRPGEVSHLREEHIEDGWWTMPGEPVPALSWPGTKNGQTHRIWLPKPAQELLPAFNARTGVVKHLDADAKDLR